MTFDPARVLGFRTRQLDRKKLRVNQRPVHAYRPTMGHIAQKAERVAASPFHFLRNPVPSDRIRVCERPPGNRGARRITYLKFCQPGHRGLDVDPKNNPAFDHIPRLLAQHAFDWVCNALSSAFHVRDAARATLAERVLRSSETDLIALAMAGRIAAFVLPGGTVAVAVARARRPEPWLLTAISAVTVQRLFVGAAAVQRVGGGARADLAVGPGAPRGVGGRRGVVQAGARAARLRGRRGHEHTRTRTAPPPAPGSLMWELHRIMGRWLILGRCGAALGICAQLGREALPWRRCGRRAPPPSRRRP